LIGQNGKRFEMMIGSFNDSEIGMFTLQELEALTKRFLNNNNSNAVALSLPQESQLTYKFN